ncbi:MAG: dihydrolipoamide acetyltransferase family protein [Victivallaceae bacterium]
MSTKVPIPKLGQSEETVTIERWLVKEGDDIKKGAILFEVETDKAVLEVESQFEGKLLKIVIPAGKQVPVMSIAAVIGEEGEAIPEIEQPKAPATIPAKPAAPVPVATKPAATSPVVKTSGKVQQEDVPFEPASPSVPSPVFHKPNPSPRAKKFAADYLIDLNKVSGTGGETGRVTEQDVKNYLETSGYLAKKITPVAFNLAQQEKLELLAISGSGDNERITMADVKDAIAEKPQEMSVMRKVIAQRLTQSKQQIPHFYVTVSIDMTDLMKKRQELKDSGINLSVNVFIVKAVALTLKEFPLVNAVTNGSSVTRKSKVNIGVAVSIDNGLVVPVVKNTDRKDLDEIQAEVAEMAEKARKGKLSPDDMKNGTFTISNMGMLNVENFCAIINPGESAILAVSSALPTPAVKDGQIVVRNMMKVTLSADHRVVDGAMGAEFVNAIKAKLEDLTLWNKII